MYPFLAAIDNIYSLNTRYSYCIFIENILQLSWHVDENSLVDYYYVYYAKTLGFSV